MTQVTDWPSALDSYAEALIQVRSDLAVGKDSIAWDFEFPGTLEAIPPELVNRAAMLLATAKELEVELEVSLARLRRHRRLAHHIGPDTAAQPRFIDERG
jgi:hypothetical protein